MIVNHHKEFISKLRGSQSIYDLLLTIIIDYTHLRGHRLTIYPVRWRLRPLRDKLSHGVNY